MPTETRNVTRAPPRDLWTRVKQRAVAHDTCLAALVR
jgi:hypothetical protein